MLGIPKRHGHYVFGVIQSGLTCAVASGIASFSFLSDGGFIRHWILSWLLSWVGMLPVVLFAAPFIRRMSDALTREEEAPQNARSD